MVNLHFYSNVILISFFAYYFCMTKASCTLQLLNWSLGAVGVFFSSPGTLLYAILCVHVHSVVYISLEAVEVTGIFLKAEK